MSRRVGGVLAGASEAHQRSCCLPPRMVLLLLLTPAAALPLIKGAASLMNAVITAAPKFKNTNIKKRGGGAGGSQSFQGSCNRLFPFVKAEQLTRLSGISAPAPPPPKTMITCKEKFYILGNALLSFSET